MQERVEPSPEEAFEKHFDQVTLMCRGAVSEILEDDNTGVPHQRFILTLPSGHTLLILNNLERAKRVPAEIGQNVEVRGKYRWNKHGGLVHETHHDDQTGLDGWVLLDKKIPEENNV